jgi:hypothetical protein
LWKNGKEWSFQKLFYQWNKFIDNVGGIQQKSCRVKKKRTVTNKEKAKMWEKIALSFNSQTIGVNRDAKVLKEKWTNFKRVTVKKYASDKTNRPTEPCFWKV